MSSEEELRLASEVVRMKAEEETLKHAELALLAERSIGRGRSDDRAMQMVLPTYCVAMYISSYMCCFLSYRIVVRSSSSKYQVP